MSETWKRVSGWSDDGDDGSPNIGRKARQWFTRSISAKLQENYVKTFGPVADNEEYAVDALVKWYADNAGDFVKWVNDATYHGKGWSSGAWVIEWDKVEQAFRRAERETGSDTFASLDDWLRYDIGHSYAFARLRRLATMQT